ncbi:MAG: membrane protein insertase YidC, partial [Candidatus Omnitrophica bacterium]|nr:membrane protein insertase YidC [Candidatus Omnitrophota bacterium]
IKLKEYEEKGKEQGLYRGKGLFVLSGGLLTGTGKEKFEIKEDQNTVEYVFTELGRVEIRKTYVFYRSLDQIDLAIKITNLSDRRQDLSYQIEGPSELDETAAISGRSFDETVALIDDKMFKIKSLKENQEKQGNIAWVGVKNRYFALIVKPADVPRAIQLKKRDNKIMTTLISREVYLGPGESVNNEYFIYAGPLKEKDLVQAGYGMERMLDYGFFGGVSKKLLSLLSFLYKITKNWGVAIILLTVLINTLLFPLTYKSFSSMQKMKKVQPHIQKLRDLHKDNPQKLNKETMELYKKYNVNPLGGCLPMLLQMPIFIALYQGLMRSVELKGAHFLWVKDLAGPDAVALPFSLPFLGDHLNILPLLMVGMMVLQQKISQGGSSEGVSEEQAKQQKMMMLMMPVFFGFLFYKMPSGLVLYWLTNTILMTGEQTFISKRTG